MMEEMLGEIEKQTLHFLFHAQVSVQAPEIQRAQTAAMSSIHAAAGAAAAGAGQRRGAGPPMPPLPGSAAPPGAGMQMIGPGGAGGAPGKPATVRHQTPKVGRNSPCPCGSGKKYKFCHGS